MDHHELFKDKCMNCYCSSFRLDKSTVHQPNEAATPSTVKLETTSGEPHEYTGGVEEKISLRSSLLREAEELTMGDRNNTYGEPHQDFARTAGALTALGYRGPDGRDIQAHDVAIMIGVVKISRLMWTPLKRDSWVDLAGYAACGYEAAELTLNPDKKEEVQGGS